MRAFAPVVEVAGDDERRAVGNFVGDQIQKPINLSPAVRLAQPEMHTDRVQWLTIAISPITAWSRPRGSAWPTDASTLRQVVTGCLCIDFFLSFFAPLCPAWRCPQSNHRFR